MSMLISLLIVLACLGLVWSRTAEEVLASMSLEEKIGQMVQIDISFFLIPGTYEVDETLLHDYILKYKIGSILNSPFSGGPVQGLSGFNATQWRSLMRKIIGNSNLTPSGVPIMYGLDSIHGATYVRDAALFPAAINLAATFDEQLAYQQGQITAKDTRAAGVPWIFAPVLGLGLQPLWARFPETLGEDPHTAAVLGAAVIKGLQAVPGDGGWPRQAAACMKHFIAYSLPTNGHDRAPVQLPDRVLKQLYLPSFQAAVDAGVLTAMESYNEVGGVPMASSSEYLRHLLRGAMGFTGMLVTDYAEIENLHSFHRVAASVQDAVALAMQQTSIDMSMVPTDTSFYTSLLSLVQQGSVEEARIDESALRVLRTKEVLGLLADTPEEVQLADPLVATVGQDSDWAASLAAARASLVLVKNSASTLPLHRGTKVFLTGPTADSVIAQCGGWALHWQGVTSEGELGEHRATVRSALSQYTPSLYLAGPSLTASTTEEVDMAAAYEAMDASEVVVVCLGEGGYAEKPGDIDALTLPAGQLSYLTALSAHDPLKPIVLVMLQGRPRLISSIVPLAHAVVLAGQPGPLGGQAVAELLVGLLHPSGRLPYTYPLTEGNVVLPYHHKPSELCTSSAGAYVPCAPQFPFGLGLSYTSWRYSDLRLSTEEVDERGTVTVSLTLTNTGSASSGVHTHTVMLFLTDLYRSVSPEDKRLVAFSKHSLRGGEQTEVSYELSAEQLAFVGVHGHYLLEDGDFLLGVSPYADCRGSADNLTASAATSSDTSSEGPMCAAFALRTSSAYDPVCSTACDMWTTTTTTEEVQTSSTTTEGVPSNSYSIVSGQGVCSRVLRSRSACMAVCRTQGWDWGHVHCLTPHYRAPPAECSSWEQVKCFDAFNMRTSEGVQQQQQSSGSSTSEEVEGFTPWEVLGLCALSAALGLGLAHLLRGGAKHSLRGAKEVEVEVEEELRRGLLLGEQGKGTELAKVRLLLGGAGAGSSV